MRGWIHKKRAPKPPRTQAEAVAEVARVRANLMEQAWVMATNRAMDRYMAEAMESVPPTDPSWPQAVLAQEELRATLRAFERLWAVYEGPLALGPLPELPAAEEVELRLRLAAQLQRAGT